MILEQRIDNILGPWPTPDQTREAFLLLARHLQRHDELVTLQRDIDAYAECRRMPDDALDALEAHRDRLRQEIWDGTPILHLAKEAEADTGLPPLEFKPMATYGWGPDAAVKQMADTVQRWTVELSQRIAKDADGKMAAALREYGFVPKAELDKAQAEVAEHRRHVATVMQREDGLKKRVEEMEGTLQSERERADREAQIGAIRLSRAEQRLRNNQACQLSEQKKDRQMIADLLWKLERAEAQNQSGKGAS